MGSVAVPSFISVFLPWTILYSGSYVGGSIDFIKLIEIKQFYFSVVVLDVIVLFDVFGLIAANWFDSNMFLIFRYD